MAGDTAVGATSSVVPVPEPDLTPRRLIERAAAMRGQLREAQAETEALGHPSDDLHREFLDAGFYRTLQPHRYGGYEFDVPTWFSVVIELARGCPSAGWSTTLIGGHALQLSSLFDEQAQTLAFGTDGDFRAPSKATPMGTATRTTDGWVIEGTWDDCSGAPLSNWFMPMVRIIDGSDGPPVFGLACVSREQWTMLDDWTGVLGVRGSGSNSIQVDQAVVPECLVVPNDMLDPDVQGGSVGSRLHGNPVYAGRHVGFFIAELVALGVGMARAAIDDYERILLERKTYFPPFIPRYESPDYQRAYGLALGLADAAEATVMHAAQRFMEACDRNVAGEDFSAELDARIAAQAQHGFQLCWDAMDLMFRTAGSSVTRDGERLQRYFRDLAMIRGHFSQQFDLMAGNLSRIPFGFAQSTSVGGASA